MNRALIPNTITLFRFLLVLPMILLLLHKQYQWAFYLFVIAGISDCIDGFLARRLNCMSQFGAIMDPLADKFLMVLTYLSLGYLGHLPAWLVAIVIGRDFIIIMGAMIYRAFIEEPKYAATFISKLNTVLQLALVVCVLFNQVYAMLPEKMIEIGMYVVASTTLTSLLDYVWAWAAKAYTAGHKGLENE